MDMAPDFFFFFFFPSPPLLPLPLSAPGVSLCSQNNAWVMSALGRRCSVQRFSTNASHNDHVLLPLCTSSTGSTPLEKNLSAVNSYRGCSLLAKYLPPPLCTAIRLMEAPLHLPCRRSAASRCVQGIDEMHAQIRTQSTHAPYAAHLLAHVRINKCRLFCIS